MAGPLENRKSDHLTLCATQDVNFRTGGNLLEQVKLVHDSLPELSANEIDPSLSLFGKRVRAPIVIAAMTGGTEEAGRINRELASIAEERGYVFGLGSQRAMHKRAETRSTYRIRDVAPKAVVLGNVGIVQASKMTTAEVLDLVESVEADALCVHLNPAMELIQHDGDRDFSGGLQTIERLVSELKFPVIVKETGCGLSPSVGTRLRHLGVEHVDVSGAGGTSWVGVETLRAKERNDERATALGDSFWDWGIPTAASVAFMKPLGFSTVVATGGLKNGLDIARAIALGATVGGIARPVLMALHAGGRKGALAWLDGVEAELRTAMLLTGSRNLEALSRAPKVIVGELATWMTQLMVSPIAAR